MMMMATSSLMVLAPSCSIHRNKKSVIITAPHKFKLSMATGLSSLFEPILRWLPQMPLQIDASKTVAKVRTKFLDAVVDSVFEFVDMPLLPSQSNYAPVEEIGEAMCVTNIQGQVPENFPEGVYIRNGPNPLFGRLKWTKSMLGRTNSAWVEGEGMVHALYFKKHKSDNGSSSYVMYNNRYIETETYKLEKHSQRPLFLPAISGDSPALFFSFLLNMLRFGELNKHYSNTNVFEHSGKFYSVSDNHIPQEIDIFTLNTLKYWDVNGTWTRPFNSHPKKVPGTGELVIFGVDAIKPFYEVGVISADGKELVHRMDVKLDRSTFCHDIGVTRSYIVILDLPVTVDLNRLFKREPLVTYEKDTYARIGIMPRYGDAESIKWFEVEQPNSTFHIINSFEDGHEVVLWGCRAFDAIIPGPKDGINDSKCFSRCYEWRMNIETGQVMEKYLTQPDVFMDFPVINPNFTGIKNRYAYTQVVHPQATFGLNSPKYGALTKLYLGEKCSSEEDKEEKEGIKVEFHKLEVNTFCSGIAFVPKEGGVDEDDGWIVTFVHNDDTNISQVYIIDTKKFSGEAVAKITMPCRVPYGFHGAFMPLLF